MSAYATPYPFIPPPGQGTGAYGLDTPLWKPYYEDNPDAAYQHYGNVQGWGWGQDPQSRFNKSQYQTLYKTYQGELPHRPLGWGWTDALNEYGPKLGDMWRSMSPNQRGEYPGNYSHKVSWIGFS